MTCKGKGMEERTGFGASTPKECSEASKGTANALGAVSNVLLAAEVWSRKRRMARADNMFHWAGGM